MKQKNKSIIEMKSLLILPFVLLPFLINAQETYTSSVTTKYENKADVTANEKPRSLTVSDSKISVTDYLGGTRTLNLKVDKIIEKEYNWSGIHKWYYCTSEENTNYIIIIKKSYPSEMTMFQVIDEVTMIQTNFSLR